MGTARPPQLVKLFAGMLSADRRLMEQAEHLLKDRYGEIDMHSEYWPFDHTQYYETELGTQVERRFLSFETLILPDTLASIKHDTNAIEQHICGELGLAPDRRPVNLDPGYLSLNKLVLATTKNYAHRIYLQQGIYAEVTLCYRNGKWNNWPWTYADYAADRYHEFFTQMRERLKNQLAGRMRQPPGVSDRE